VGRIHHDKTRRDVCATRKHLYRKAAKVTFTGKLNI
jgi:hypothetical protein